MEVVEDGENINCIACYVSSCFPIAKEVVEKVRKIYSFGKFQSMDM